VSRFQLTDDADKVLAEMQPASDGVKPSLNDNEQKCRATPSAISRRAGASSADTLRSPDGITVFVNVHLNSTRSCGYYRGMSQQRKAKLKKREEHRRRAAQNKHDFVNGALRCAGVYEAFGRLVPGLQETWRNAVQPAPEIVLDATTAGTEYGLGIQREFPPVIRKPMPAIGQKISIQEMICCLLPIKSRAERLVKHIHALGEDLSTPPNRDIIGFTSQLCEYMDKHQVRIINDLASMLWVTMLFNSLIDERMMSCTYTHRLSPAGKPVVQIVVNLKTPERATISVDGRPRPAFRCCASVGVAGLREIAWNASDIGFADDRRDYPVFMQAHALEQLKRRAPCTNPVFHIVLSLLLPKFIRTSADHFLLEYRHMTYKLGYFVGVRLSDCVLLKTFLFLTMQGTPESDLLYRKLRLTRSDIEFMKLDELAAFRDNEVRNDPSLVKLLEECGCGHLLTLSAEDLPDESPTGYADGLRKYLGHTGHLGARFPTPSIDSIAAADSTQADISDRTLWGRKL